MTNDILSLKNEAAIKESVKNIVLYNFYEKPFDPGFGGNIIGLLFENSTPTMVQRLRIELSNLLRYMNLELPLYQLMYKVKRIVMS